MLGSCSEFCSSILVGSVVEEAALVVLELLDGVEVVVSTLLSGAGSSGAEQLAISSSVAARGSNLLIMELHCFQFKGNDLSSVEASRARGLLVITYVKFHSLKSRRMLGAFPDF